MLVQEEGEEPVSLLHLNTARHLVSSGTLLTLEHLAQPLRESRGQGADTCFVFFPLTPNCRNSAPIYYIRTKHSFLSPFCQQVDLERTFTFRNSKQTYSGIPIIVANMDTVGTFEMAAVMSQVRWCAIFFSFATHSMDRLSGSHLGLV